MTGDHTALTDLLARLDTLDDDGTIFVTRPWTADSDAVVIDEEIDETTDRDGRSYLLEVGLARDVARVWSEWRGGQAPDIAQLCSAVIFYAEHDAWEPVETFERDVFVAAVERARHHHPLWFDLPSDRPPPPGEVERVERELGSTLPSDFVWFLERYGGGDFALARTWSLDPTSDAHLLAHQRWTARDDVVGFADDGTGLVFAFPVVDGACVHRVLTLDTDDGTVADTGEAFLDFMTRTAFS